MSKKILFGLLVTIIALTILISTAAFAQESDATLEALYEQIYELRRQVVERRIELGQLTEEEGSRMFEVMEERFLERSEEGSGRFYGMWGRGWRGDGDGARGFGHCWRD